VATIAAVIIFVAAAHWQQRRMHEKESLRAKFDAAAALVPVARGASVTADWNSLRYRAVTATGEYDTRQILLDNRVHDGHAGYHVITPLVLRRRTRSARQPGMDAAGRVACRAPEGGAAAER
jgi:surfeit locus 1 family protein